MEESERSRNSVAEFEASVGNRFQAITEKGRSKLNSVSKKGVKPTDASSMLNSIDPNIVCEGVKAVNDMASDAFISMMVSLKEFSATGENVNKKKGHRTKNLYGRHMLGFFAARPVRRNDYVNDADAMKAY